MTKSNICCLVLLILGCSNSPSNAILSDKMLPASYLECSDSSCFGTYRGPEFVAGNDVAHQFSNKMANAVGDKLKELYHERKFAKVDLKNIIMTTKDMDGRGDVTYNLTIPIIQVADSCLAFTAFDHRGGWGHTPKLATVLDHFSKAKGLKYQFAETQEGLTEYWLQWRAERLQGACDK